ncbi:MAG: hypothetical protein L6R40_003887 [Gallowayella cf. fulva]|nr:MAG: hypothetical protein L6R40_003887 [Xanthomendoza cf. fulva]
MTKHTFHLTPHASTRLYHIISSPLLRLVQLSLTLLSILFFSIGAGLADKYIGAAPYADLGLYSDFCEKFSLGWVFLHVIWLVFLLVWHGLNKPKLHPGYYIGIDLYLGISTLAAMATMFAFSAFTSPEWGGGEDDCQEPSDSCTKHWTSIRGVDNAAYAFAFPVAYVLCPISPIRVTFVIAMHLIIFGVACRVCTVYDREKRTNKNQASKLHTFHLTPHAFTAKYRFISSPKFRLVHLFLTSLSILLFSVGTGLASAYIHGESTEISEEVSLGVMFMSVIWLVSLLVRHVLKRPQLHPGFYIGLDLYVGLSVLIALITGVMTSRVVGY